MGDGAAILATDHGKGRGAMGLELVLDLWGLSVRLGISEKTAIVALVCLNMTAIWAAFAVREWGRRK